MTFLDSSAIIDYLDGVDDVIRYIDEETEPPYFTSTMCIYEVTMGEVHTQGSSDVQGERAKFDWVNSLSLTEQIAMDAARLQHQLKQTGELTSARDILIAATARSTGDRLVVADADFETEPLEAHMAVTNLRK